MANQTQYAKQPIGTIARRHALSNALNVEKNCAPGYNGNGYFSGLVTDDGTAFPATIQVWHQASHRLVKTGSSGLDGQYTIGNLDPTQTYDLIAVDPSGEREKLISSSRIPEVGWLSPVNLFLHNTSSMVAGGSYTGQITAMGGNGSYTYSISSAPGWLSANSSTGAVTGTNDGTRYVDFTITATDSISNTKSIPVSLVFYTDPFWASTLFALKFNGTNGSQVFTDVIDSLNWTVTATAQVSTAQQKYGTGSGTVQSGTSNSKIFRNGTAKTRAIGTGNFTIEFFFRYTSNVTMSILDCRHPINTIPDPTIWYTSNTITYYTNGSPRITGPSLATNTWHHIAVCRADGITRMFVNGTQVGSNYNDTNSYVFDDFNLMNSYNTIYTFPGWIDDFRFTADARYTSSFTPPTSELDYP